ncbi:leucine-rich repeat-containing protein 27-like [Symphorus nematophorus]
MTSPEKEEVPDLQLSCVFGNSVVKSQDAEPHEPPEYYTTEALRLSKTNLNHVPESILKNTCGTYLYFEGNQISSIPGSLFISLPKLLWLDLRKNQIASLPAEIGLHRCLRTLLLEGNPISELPPELGNVISLTGLNLRDCPIIFPPPHIVKQGYQSILQYLRSAMAERPVSMRKTPPALPVVEKLQLPELLGSSMDEQDESVDEDELQRFMELKHKMILLDQAELSSIAPSDRTPKSPLLPANQRKKATTKAIVPKLPLFDTKHWKRLEERRQAAMKELKEKQANLEQRRNQETFRKCRTQAKITQEKKISAEKKKDPERRRKQKEGEDSNPHVEDSSDIPRIQTPCTSITECERSRSARKVERQISGHIEKMQKRRMNPRGETTEVMAVSEIDVEEVRKLQARLQEKKKNLQKDLQNCFTVFSVNNPGSFLDF